MGKRVGSPEGGNPPWSYLLVTAPTNAQVDNLQHRVHEECYSYKVFRKEVLADHPAPWLRLRAQRAAGGQLTTRPLPDPVLGNPIYIMDLDSPQWWEEVRDSMGQEQFAELWQLVLNAWDSLRIDDMLA